MHSGQEAVSSPSSVLHKGAETETRQQQHQHDSLPQALRLQGQQDAQHGPRNQQPDDQEQHVDVHLGSQDQQPQHCEEQQPQQCEEQQQQQQRMKEFPHQHGEQFQQQQQAQAPQEQPALPGKPCPDGNGRTRGGVYRRRSRRIGSVRFNIPPSPGSDTAADSPAALALPVAELRATGVSADSVSSAASPDGARAPETLVTADADACSPWSATAPALTAAGAEHTAAGVAPEEATAGTAAAAATEAVGTILGRRRAGATGVVPAETEDRPRVVESLPRAADADAARLRDATRGGIGNPLRSVVRPVEEKPQDSDAATPVHRNKDFQRYSSSGPRAVTRPVAPADLRDGTAANDTATTYRGPTGDTSDAFAFGNGVAAVGVAERGAAWSFTGAAAARSATAAADGSEAESFSAAAKWNFCSAAVPSVGGARLEGRPRKVAGGSGSRKETASARHRSSESSSSSSSGESETEPYDDDQQHPMAKRLGIGPWRSRVHQVGSFSAARSTALHQEDGMLRSASAAARVPLAGNGIRVAESDAPSDATAVIGATAMEATLAVDAAAGAAFSPPGRWRAADDEAAALRQGRAHILASSTSTSCKRRLDAGNRSRAAPAICTGSAAPSTCASGSSGNPSPVTAAGCRPVAATRHTAAEGTPLPVQAIPEDAAQATEDALEYSSDWSAFRRSTGRCTIVNPGAAVSFIKTTAGAWHSAGGYSGGTHTRSRGGELLLRNAAGGALPCCASAEAFVEQPHQRVSRDAAASSATTRSYYLNAAAVHAAATADAAAHYLEERGLAAAARSDGRASSGVALCEDQQATMQLPVSLSERSRTFDFHNRSRRPSASSLQAPRKRCEADAAETESLPGTSRSSTGRQLLSWWWGRRTQDQQPLRPASPSQVLKRAQQQRDAQEQQHSLQQHQQHPQQQDHEMLPLPSRRQRWSSPLPATLVKTSDGETGSGRSNKDAEATELERLLDLEGKSDGQEIADLDALQKEDLEAIVCNIQQVKKFLVGKLRECEAALLATATERDDMEASLKEMDRSLQQKEEQRVAAVKQLQAENAEKSNEVKRLQEELTWLQERERVQQQQIQQLQDEAVLLRAEVHDRVAASALEQESLLAVMKKLQTDKGALQEQVQQLQQALAKSRQQLASALSRVDELEAFAPPALCGDSSRGWSSSSSSSPTASTSAVDSLRPAWWSVSNRDSPQRLPQQRPRQQQHGGQQQQEAAVSINDVDTNTRRNSSDQCRSPSQLVRNSPEKAHPMEGSGRRHSATASCVLPPPAVSTPLDLSYVLQQQRQSQLEEPTLQQQQGSNPQQPGERVSTERTRDATEALLLQRAAADDVAAAPQNNNATEYVAVQQFEGDAVDEGEGRRVTGTTRDEDDDGVAVSTPSQPRGGTREAADSAAATSGIPAHLAESLTGTRAVETSRDAAKDESMGHAGKIKEALTGGVTRVLQHLENVLTVEDRLIINESGVYTEDGVCLHRVGFATSPVGGLYASLLQQQEKPRPAPAQRQQREEVQQNSKQQEKQLQEKKESQGKSGSTEADHQSGVHSRGLSSSTVKCVRGGAASIDRSSASRKTTNVLVQRSSGRGSELDKQPKNREPDERRPPPPPSCSDDLVVVLSETEDDKPRNTENDRSTSRASRSKQAYDRAAERSTPTAGSAAGAPQRARVQRQALDYAKASSVSSSASDRVSRSSSGVSVGETVRDAVCSVLHAVHQRAVEVYIHPSSVLPTVPAAGAATSTVVADSSVQQAGSSSPSMSAGAVADDSPAAASGNAATQKSKPQQQQHHGGTQPSKGGRGRPSAWEHLLQRHREAQQMPLFGSTPYPGATMSSASRQAGTSSGHMSSSAGGWDTTTRYRSSSNGSHKPRSRNDASAASTSDCPSSAPTDSEVGTGTHATAPAPVRQKVAHLQKQQPPQQDHKAEEKVEESVPGEEAHVAQHKLCVQAGNEEEYAVQATSPDYEEPSVQHRPAQHPVSDDEEGKPRSNRVLLHQEHGETVECDGATGTRIDVEETEQEEPVAVRRQQVMNASAAARQGHEAQEPKVQDHDWAQTKQGMPSDSVFVESSSQHGDVQQPVQKHHTAHGELVADRGGEQERQERTPNEDKDQKQDTVKGEGQLNSGGGKEREHGSNMEEQQQQPAPDCSTCQNADDTAAQKDDVSLKGSSRRQRDEGQEHQVTQQVKAMQPEGTQKQVQNVKLQQDGRQRAEAGRDSTDAEEQHERNAQHKFQQEEQTTQDLEEQGQQAEQEKAPELQPESGQRRQQQGIPHHQQQKASHPRGKHQGQRKAGSTKNTGRQRRK